ncbi:hypothetical protein SAMN05421690_101145 [Nitrosomonas sp. Nm51]|nr:hypothetical protein SAMN05421690_101145 [Nitrosomonas sp. Nm51]
MAGLYYCFIYKNTVADKQVIQLAPNKIAAALPVYLFLSVLTVSDGI